MRRNGAFVGSAARSSGGRRSTATRTPSSRSRFWSASVRGMQRARPEHQAGAHHAPIDGGVPAQVTEIAGAFEKAATVGGLATDHSKSDYQPPDKVNDALVNNLSRPQDSICTSSATLGPPPGDRLPLRQPATG